MIERQFEKFVLQLFFNYILIGIKNEMWKKKFMKNVITTNTLYNIEYVQLLKSVSYIWRDKEL